MNHHPREEKNQQTAHQYNNQDSPLDGSEDSNQNSNLDANLGLGQEYDQNRIRNAPQPPSQLTDLEVTRAVPGTNIGARVAVALGGSAVYARRLGYHDVAERCLVAGVVLLVGFWLFFAV